MSTLTEALAHGRGEERPFRCEAHPDTTASASVNVTKMVWVCYACGASGGVDGKAKAPPLASLSAMLDPDDAARHYPESYLDLFVSDITYWRGRFAPFVIRHFGLGWDPFTDCATFPVRTPSGALAGVGRRRGDEAVAKAKDEGTNPSRYLYPKRWSASRSLFGWRAWPGEAPKVVALVEGAADAIACWEVGVPALACYGAGLHLPQRELLAQLAPRMVLSAFDADDAGERAHERTEEYLHDLCTVARVKWQSTYKDPAGTPRTQRLSDLSFAVGASGYRDHQQLLESWSQTKAQLQTSNVED